MLNQTNKHNYNLEYDTCFLRETPAEFRREINEFFEWK